METKILKVVRQGEAFSVQSAKAETGFSTHEYQGQTFQEVLATDIVKMK